MDKHNPYNLPITHNLSNVLSELKPEDAQVILDLKEELSDTWEKKQIFRTETEMRVSVLNDGKHPTTASKYWQAVREQNSMFESIIGNTFDIRKEQLKKEVIERKLQKAIDENKDLKIKKYQIDLDEKLFVLASLKQQIQDRVRELKLWSKIKSELDDGSFNTQDVNDHQTTSYYYAFKNRAQSVDINSGPAEIINAIGPFKTLARLKTENNKLLSFNEAKGRLHDIQIEKFLLDSTQEVEQQQQQQQQLPESNFTSK